MHEVATTATLVDDASFDGGPVTATVSRSEIEAMLSATVVPGLWFDLGFEDEEASRVTVELTPSDLDEILRRAPGDEVVLSLDGQALAGLLEGSDVEAHGIRGALAIAVVAGAIAAPAGLAATPQVSSAAAPQVLSAAVTSQVAPATVESQVSRAVAREQVSRAGAKTQVSRSLVVKASGIKFLRSGLAR